MPSGFLVANHGNGFRVVRELQGPDLWEAACYSAPQQAEQGDYAPLFVANAVKWQRVNM